MTKPINAVVTRNPLFRQVLCLLLATAVGAWSCKAQIPPAPSPEGSALAGAHHILVLGDSITYSGQYVDDLEAFLRIRGLFGGLELLDLGLPSETVSGLSEPGHAGGKFPRPDLHERLGAASWPRRNLTSSSRVTA